MLRLEASESDFNSSVGVHEVCVDGQEDIEGKSHNIAVRENLREDQPRPLFVLFPAVLLGEGVLLELNSQAKNDNPDGRVEVPD